MTQLCYDTTGGGGGGEGGGGGGRGGGGGGGRGGGRGGGGEGGDSVLTRMTKSRCLQYFWVFMVCWSTLKLLSKVMSVYSQYRLNHFYSPSRDAGGPGSVGQVFSGEGCWAYKKELIYTPMLCTTSSSVARTNVSAKHWYVHICPFHRLHAIHITCLWPNCRYRGWRTQWLSYEWKSCWATDCSFRLCLNICERDIPGYFQARFGDFIWDYSQLWLWQQTLVFETRSRESPAMSGGTTLVVFDETSGYLQSKTDIFKCFFWRKPTQITIKASKKTFKTEP